MSLKVVAIIARPLQAICTRLQGSEAMSCDVKSGASGSRLLTGSTSRNRMEGFDHLGLHHPVFERGKDLVSGFQKPREHS